MQYPSRVSFYRVLALSVAFFSVEALPALAGAPFTTDDPEPTPYRNYEIDVASDYARSSDAVEVTVPHFEIDYGLLPNVEISVTLPIAGSKVPHGAMKVGYGDTQFAVKGRIIQETDHFPQISLAPAIVLPSGNANTGLGGGYTKAFLPVWAEKGFGKYTVYGGAGRWHNPGAGNQDYTFSGVAVIRDMGHGWTVGTELFGQSADTVGGASSLGYNFGAVRQYDEHHQLAVSVGRSLHGPNTFSAYAAIGFLLGPKDKSGPDKPDADAGAKPAGTEKAESGKDP